MTKVFIGGSRRISRLSPEVQSRLNRIIEKCLPVLIGDANGADKAVQQYLYRKGYKLVEVFCAEDICRNNLGGWPVRIVPSNGKRRDFNFYTTKDRVMAEEASVGFMIWDGKSVGTLLNVLRLVRQQKTVVVYITSAKKFVNLNKREDWKRFMNRCTPDIWQRLESKAAAEQQYNRPLHQANLF